MIQLMRKLEISQNDQADVPHTRTKWSMKHISWLKYCLLLLWSLLPADCLSLDIFMNDGNSTTLIASPLSPTSRNNSPQTFDPVMAPLIRVGSEKWDNADPCHVPASARQHILVVFTSNPFGCHMCVLYNYECVQQGCVGMIRAHDLNAATTGFVAHRANWASIETNSMPLVGLSGHEDGAEFIITQKPCRRSQRYRRCVRVMALQYDLCRTRHLCFPLQLCLCFEQGYQHPICGPNQEDLVDIHVCAVASNVLVHNTGDNLLLTIWLSAPLLLVYRDE